MHSPARSAAPGGFSDGRDIGVVCNLPREDGPVVLPMAGDVGGQYTPAAGWAQAITYHRDVLGDAHWADSIAVAMGGDASVATSGFWSALTMATTLRLPMLFYIEDNGLGISVGGDMQTPGGNIAKNLAAFGNLLIRDGDGTDPATTARLLDRGGRPRARWRRAGAGAPHRPAAVQPLRARQPEGVPHRRGDRRRLDARPASAAPRAPRPRDVMSEAEWSALEAEVERDVNAALDAARARGAPSADKVKRYIYAEPVLAGDPRPSAGCRPMCSMHSPSTGTPADDGDTVRFAEAVRRTLRHELSVNPRVAVFGEDVGRKGGVHLVTEGLQKQFGAARVFDTSLSEEGIIGRAVGMAAAGLMPVAEIQFRKYADPATEQLNNCGTMRWRTNNQFAAPIVVRMPGGFGKDVGDPWHSLSDEVRFAKSIGWQVVMPSNARDAVGLLRSAMRSLNPTIFFEHRSLLMTSDGSARYPGDDYVRADRRGRIAIAEGDGDHGGDVGGDGAPLRRGGAPPRGWRRGAHRPAQHRAVGPRDGPRLGDEDRAVPHRARGYADGGIRRRDRRDDREGRVLAPRCAGRPLRGGRRADAVPSRAARGGGSRRPTQVAGAHPGPARARDGRTPAQRPLDRDGRRRHHGGRCSGWRRLLRPAAVRLHASPGSSRWARSGCELLPGLYTGERLGWLDALFTATSAVCVTGLIVVDTATYFTFAGQLFLLALIQLGGLGMIAFTTLIILALGKRLSLRAEALAAWRVGRGGAASSTSSRLGRDVVRFTLAFEAVGRRAAVHAVGAGVRLGAARSGRRCSTP